MDEAEYRELKHFFGEMRKDPENHKELLQYIALHPSYVIRRLKLKSNS